MLDYAWLPSGLTARPPQTSAKKISKPLSMRLMTTLSADSGFAQILIDKGAAARHKAIHTLLIA